MILGKIIDGSFIYNILPDYTHLIYSLWYNYGWIPPQ